MGGKHGWVIRKVLRRGGRLSRIQIFGEEGDTKRRTAFAKSKEAAKGKGSVGRCQPGRGPPEPG